MAGFSHPVEVANFPHVKALLWTVHRGFHQRTPNNQSLPPGRICFFSNTGALLLWKKEHMPPSTAYTVHLNCFSPEGVLQKGRPLLSFDND